MNPEVMDLRQQYDALIQSRKTIRQKVKAEFQEKISEEVKVRTRYADTQFAISLKAAKDSGMSRSEIAEAMRSNDHRRMKYFLDLAGSEGFQRGRPGRTEEEKAAIKRGYEVIDVKNGVVRVYAMCRHVFSEPFLAQITWRLGGQYILEPWEGSDLTEYQEMLRAPETMREIRIVDGQRIWDDLTARGYVQDSTWSGSQYRFTEEDKGEDIDFSGFLNN